MGILSGLLGGGEQTQTTKSSPWGPQQDYLKDVFGQAQGLYQNQSPYIGQATQMRADRAMQGSPLVQGSQDEMLNVIQGNYMPGSEAFNTRFGDSMGMIGRQITPQIDSRFAGSGRFGSGLHQIGLGQAMADAGTNLYNQMYESERGRQMQAFGMAPQMAAQDYQDIDQLRSAGMDPWRQLQAYQGAVGGNYGGTQTQTTPTGSPLGALAGGAAGLYFGGGSPEMGALGASLGGLLS